MHLASMSNCGAVFLVVERGGFPVLAAHSLGLSTPMASKRAVFFGSL